MDIINKNRCAWCGNDPHYISYHDNQWGVPVYEDKKIFSSLTLEIFQAGLSWITILKKKENFYTAFDGFNYRKIAAYSDKKLETLIKNPSIIRNKVKIISTRENARCFIDIINEFGTFSKYIWRYVDNKPIINHFNKAHDVPSRTRMSDIVSSDLKKRGFKFIGPTIIYSLMQDIGMVNDHTTNCFRYNQI
jgi:DNA-3-methyladenine glycosylase I